VPWKVTDVFDENIIGASKIARDITAERTAEKALRAGETKYRTTFDIAPVGITHISPSCRYLMANDFFCTLLGYERDELLAMDPFSNVDPAATADLRLMFEKLCAREMSSGQITTQFAHKDGRPRTSSQRSAVGNILSTSGFFPPRSLKLTRLVCANSKFDGDQHKGLCNLPVGQPTRPGGTAHLPLEESTNHSNIPVGP